MKTSTYTFRAKEMSHTNDNNMNNGRYVITDPAQIEEVHAEARRWCLTALERVRSRRKLASELASAEVSSSSTMTTTAKKK